MAEVITGAAAIAIASWATYEAAKTLDQWINKSDTANETEKIPDVQAEAKEKKKSKDVYTPDRDLPRDKDGRAIPDTDAPHTQLGTKEGRKGEYPQAREFDEHGNPMRDIDFTDHNRPQNHPNPHQHEYKPNPTGGTRIRDPNAQPITGWDYL